MDSHLKVGLEKHSSGITGLPEAFEAFWPTSRGFAQVRRPPARVVAAQNLGLDVDAPQLLTQGLASLGPLWKWFGAPVKGMASVE